MNSDEEHLVAVRSVTEVLEADDDVLSGVDVVDVNVLGVEDIVGKDWSWGNEWHDDGSVTGSFESCVLWADGSGFVRIVLVAPVNH